jgi:peroxiredoxin Q/BCP
VKTGELAPDFTLPGTEGDFTLSEQRGRNVVLLFYPGDFTPVCTRQFSSYGQCAADFADLDAVVVGISAQGLDSHRRFAAANEIPFPLLADTDRAVAKAYGVSAPVLGTRRALVIVDAEGRIAHHDVHTFGLTYRSVDDIRAALSAAGLTAR